MVTTTQVLGVVEEGIAGFDVAAAAFDEGRETDDIGGSVVSLEGDVAGHFIQADEQGRIEIRPIEHGIVAGRDRGSHAEKRVFHPDAVLKQQRHQPNGKRQIERGVLVGKSANDVAEIPFEEERIGALIPKVPGVVREYFAIVVDDTVELIAFVQGPHEHVDPLGGGDRPIEFEIEAVGPDGLLVADVLVVGKCRAIVTVDIELLLHQIRAAEGRAGAGQGTRFVKRQAPFNGRSLNWVHVLAAVDSQLTAGIPAELPVVRTWREVATVVLCFATPGIVALLADFQDPAVEFRRGRQVAPTVEHGPRPRQGPRAR